MKVQLLSVHARAGVRAVIDHASSAASGHPPTMGKSVSEGLDFHQEQIENKLANLATRKRIKQ